MKARTPRVDQAELLRRTFDFDVFACACVAADELGPPFHRNHRYPGTRSVISGRFSARADSAPKPQGRVPSVVAAVPRCTAPPR